MKQHCETCSCRFPVKSDGCVCDAGSWVVTKIPPACKTPDMTDTGYCRKCEHDAGCHQ
jgi:hypothetical protein